MNRPALPYASILLAGCTLTPEQASDKLQAALVGAVDGNDEIHGAVLHVDAPSLGLSGTWAHGIADARDAAPFTAQTPFLSASIGKLFVAAAVLDLVDEGALGLHDPVTRWVPGSALSGLPVVGGDAALGQLTVAMLLGNRSGLPDYFDDRLAPAHTGAPNVLERMLAEPDRIWTRDDLLGHTRDHFAPFAPPGEAFFYSNANWDLLGLVLEGVTGQPWHDVVQQRVITPLGLDRTWFYNLTPPPSGVPDYADVWVGEVNVTRYPSLSADQAGGGLATTAEDLGRLLRGLEAGQPVSIDALGAAWSDDAMSRGIDYGYGMWRLRPGRMFFLLGGLPELRGASGSTGSFAYIVPEDGTVLTGSFNQTDWAEGHVRFLLSSVLPVLSRARAPR